jgi:hypothetical protein
MYTENGEKPDQRYVSGRIMGTVVRLKEQPVLVTGENGDNSFSVRVLKTGRNKVVNLHDLDPSSPPLGYTNVGGASFYLSRRALRRDWRQGLRHSNITVLCNNNRQKKFTFEGYSSLVAPILNEYPSFKECCKRVKDIFTSSAFSRAFAVNEDMLLVYKGSAVVGAVKNGVPVLEKDFFWLQEYLDEIMEDNR